MARLAPSEMNFFISPSTWLLMPPLTNSLKVFNMNSKRQFLISKLDLQFALIAGHGSLSFADGYPAYDISIPVIFDFGGSDSGCSILFTFDLSRVFNESELLSLYSERGRVKGEVEPNAC